MSILGGFALGIGTLPALGLDDATAEFGASSKQLVSAPASATEIRELKDDPETAEYEPFVGCSADYLTGPGAALDRNNLIGPENSVLVSPAEMSSMGRPEAEVKAQAQAWSQLSVEERDEQLCRAAEQDAVIHEQR